MRAVMAGQADMASLLLEEGADVAYINPVHANSLFSSAYQKAYSILIVANVCTGQRDHRVRPGFIGRECRNCPPFDQK